MPSRPKELSPQHRREPPERITQVLSPAAEMAVAVFPFPPPPVVAPPALPLAPAALPALPLAPAAPPAPPPRAPPPSLCDEPEPHATTDIASGTNKAATSTLTPVPVIWRQTVAPAVCRHKPRRSNTNVKDLVWKRALGFGGALSAKSPLEPPRSVSADPVVSENSSRSRSPVLATIVIRGKQHRNFVGDPRRRSRHCLGATDRDTTIPRIPIWTRDGLLPGQWRAGIGRARACRTNRISLVGEHGTTGRRRQSVVARHLWNGPARPIGPASSGGRKRAPLFESCSRRGRMRQFADLGGRTLPRCRGRIKATGEHHRAPGPGSAVRWGPVPLRETRGSQT
jgi:hypothetical protein